MKKPWLAALLNVTPVAAGYLYLGLRGRFIAFFFIDIAAAFVSFISIVVIATACVSNRCSNGGGLLGLFWAIFPILSIAGYTVWDGWQLAKGYNNANNG